MPTIKQLRNDLIKWYDDEDTIAFMLWTKDDVLEMVNDGEIMPTLVKAIQELSAKVEALENA